MSNKVRADQIKHALSKRHTEDLFFTEVKNGSTWTNKNLLKIDALAIKKSWSKPCFTGYEVKVNRQDFLRDEKWPGYREQCHRLYFACPTGLIKPDELPDDIGLVYYSPETGGLFTKKKALFREIEIKAEMLYYILLSRTESDRHPFFSEQRDVFTAYVHDKAERRELAYQVKSKLVEELLDLRKQLSNFKNDNDRLKNDLTRFEELSKLLRNYDIHVHSWRWKEEIETRLQNGVGSDVKRLLGYIVKNAQEAEKMLQQG